MNEHAIPVLIAFLTVAGIAAFLLYRALTTLKRQEHTGETFGNQVTTTAPTDITRAQIRSGR